MRGPELGDGLPPSGRVFQVEVYLGPAAGPSVRRRMNALLDSLEITPLG